MQVITYAIMSNHFHILVRVPEARDIPDTELIRRYRVLYPRPTKHATAHAEVLEEVLAAGGMQADLLRKRLLKLMGSLSAFMKLLKQRFSVWFNRTRHRYGTLWAERFTSVLVEGTYFAVKTVAAYIDLNPVRAGLVSDPAEYRFCGYGEAVASGRCGRLHLGMAMSAPEAMSDRQILDSYRVSPFTKGAANKAYGSKSAKLSRARADRIARKNGKMPLAERLRHRVAWMIGGAVIGSKLFVETALAEYRLRTGRRKHSGPQQPDPGVAWSGRALFALRHCRTRPV